MQNQFSQAGRSPYHRTNSSVHATKAVDVLNTSTSSVYFLDTQARLVLQMSFQSPALSRLTAANGIRVWTEIQLSHGRCQTISGGCWDRGMQMLLRWQEFRIWKSLQCPQKCMMVLVSAQGEEDRRDLLPQASITAICTSCSGQTSQEKQRDLDFGFGESHVGYSWHKQGLATLLSCWCRAFLPTPCAALPDASKKTATQSHVSTAIIWCAEVSGPC